MFDWGKGGGGGGGGALGGGGGDSGKKGGDEDEVGEGRDSTTVPSAPYNLFS